MIVRVGDEALTEIRAYLHLHYAENIYLLSELRQRPNSSLPGGDPLSLVGYRRNGTLVAVQGFYHLGRCFPFCEDEEALESMVYDARRRRPHWIMGARRSVDPLLEGMLAEGFHLVYDELDQVCMADLSTLVPCVAEGVRPATEGDIEAIAELRRAFEHEYFGTPLEQIDRGWCLRIARRYLARGVYVAERDGEIVSMAAVEAAIPEVVQVGAVYTVPEHRGQGLARAVVSALCLEQLQQIPQVSLVVRNDNLPAWRAYAALGFHPHHSYRMSQLA
ncbi:MAG: GNAT family N-acetyltransferase [Chloroflexi bacterium]|nr:GNAT family N-acetyltransferase [Chloroflexota bacterium]